MKVLVLGGVAAGTKAAAKLKREDRSMEIRILTKGKDISYAGCGLPYYIGHMIEDREGLIVNTPASFSALTGVDVVTGADATGVDFASRKVSYIKDGKLHEEGYDKLIIATGAESIVPPVEGTGLEGVFTVRTPDDAQAIRSYAGRDDVRSAVIVGAGFIGLEVAENLMADGLDVAVMDMAPSIMPNAFDAEMALWARKQIVEAGVRVMPSTRLEAIVGTGRAEGVKTDKGMVPADMGVLALGVRPATSFPEGCHRSRP